MYQGEAGGYLLAIYQKELIKEKERKKEREVKRTSAKIRNLHGGSRNRIYPTRGRAFI